MSLLRTSSSKSLSKVSLRMGIPNPLAQMKSTPRYSNFVHATVSGKPVCSQGNGLRTQNSLQSWLLLITGAVTLTSMCSQGLCGVPMCVVQVVVASTSRDVITMIITNSA